MTQRVSGYVGHENVSAAPTTHYPFGLVNARPGNVAGTVDVLKQKHRPAVYTHADFAERIFSKCAGDIHSASSRLFRGSEKDQSHAVASRQRNQIAAGVRPLELVGRLN
jgi:hypothetical protein